MLESLSIRNIALIEKQTIEFKEGLNVLSGETGAGKSLIIDSLSLLLGERADRTLITKGQSFLSVEAVFTHLSQEVLSIMEDLGLECEDNIVISRKITLDGKNECRVNGKYFTLSMLKKLTAPLMDLHGQFEHQNLLKTSKHLNILDLYGYKDIKPILAEYKVLFNTLKEIEDELGGISTDYRERQRLIDLYTYQFEEIENAGFYDGEEEELKEYRNQVLHFEKIMQTLNAVCELASGDGYQYLGLADSIKKMGVMLGSVSQYNKDINEFVERLDSLKIELEDVVDSLENVKDNLYFDQDKANLNEQRLDLLSSFKKKYGSSIKEINDFAQNIKSECNKLIDSEERIEKLTIQREKCLKDIERVATSLTNARQKVALVFEKEIEKELKELGMKNSNFVVGFEKLELDKRTNNGCDKVEFMFSANLGQDVKPLKFVASGGEMSRFMLAVKNVTARIEKIGTLVFDEIDSGVSGHNALIVAQKLATVSQTSQVICVTHLPQIASYGSNHLFIEKTDIEGRTITKVETINGEQRVVEIARLISGNITDRAIAHATELLENGNKFNQNLK